MNAAEEGTARWGATLAWAAALALYGACWLLPITDGNIGFDGARFAHEEAWKLITEGRAIESAGDVFGVIFVAMGWLANELFVLGVALLPRRPRFAVRSLAFGLGIMVSWQVAFADEFPAPRRLLVLGGGGGDRAVARRRPPGPRDGARRGRRSLRSGDPGVSHGPDTERRPCHGASRLTAAPDHAERYGETT